MRLKLVCHAAPGYFPQPIISLYDFLRRRSHQIVNYWAFTVDFLREVLTEDGADTWQTRFEEIAQRHLLNDSRPREELWKLLQGVYSLKLEGNKDPRGRFLEYVVYRTVPYVVEESGESEYECALHQQLRPGRTRRVVQSTATFDAGFLNDAAFEGHECKANLWNFLSHKGELSQAAKRKLGFMQAVSVVVEESGRQCHLFLISLQHRPTAVRAFLSHVGYEKVGILDPDDIESRLVA